MQLHINHYQINHAKNVKRKQTKIPYYFFFYGWYSLWSFHASLNVLHSPKVSINLTITLTTTLSTVNISMTSATQVYALWPLTSNQSHVLISQPGPPKHLHVFLYEMKRSPYQVPDIAWIRRFFWFPTKSVVLSEYNGWYGEWRSFVGFKHLQRVQWIPHKWSRYEGGKQHFQKSNTEYWLLPRCVSDNKTFVLFKNLLGRYATRGRNFEGLSELKISSLVILFVV